MSATIDRGLTETRPPAVSRLDGSLEQVLTRVRLRARRRAAWLRKLWNEECDRDGSVVVTHAEIDAHLAGADSPEAETTWLASEEAVGPLNDALADVETALASDGTSRLARLETIFGLSARESDLFQACLAADLDPALGRVYAYLQDHAGRAYVTEALVARLFGHGREGTWNAESALRRWDLVREQEVAPAEPARLACDPLVRDWLQGRNGLDEALVRVAALHQPHAPLSGWPVEDTAAMVDRMARGDARARVRLQVAGLPGSGRRTFAAAVSARLGLSLLVVHTADADEQEWSRLFLRAQRQAYLDGCALAWQGRAALQHRWPVNLPCFPVQFVISETVETLPPAPDLVDHRIEVPLPTCDERRRLWAAYFPDSCTWSPSAFEALVAGHGATPGAIAAAARHGASGADEAAALLREAAQRHLSTLAQRLECPFAWDDLVVPDRLHDALDDFVFEARERDLFWERPEARRLFPQGRGLLALFTGPPGTGKTMAAQVIAASVGLDLFRIDLAAVVSKYVGETSQNLERILSRAAHADVVLLFDEADALFGKRTEIHDAHDRFANIDTNYLLQAIESYRGIALLATNQKQNIDGAFVRRLRYVLDFPVPDAPQRLRIWRQIVAELVGPGSPQAMSQDLEALAEGVELTGAQIKFAVLGAIFGARREGVPPAARHLLRGIERELMKEGRGLSDRDRKRMFDRAR